MFKTDLAQGFDLQGRENFPRILVSVCRIQHDACESPSRMEEKRFTSLEEREARELYTVKIVAYTHFSTMCDF